MSSIFRFSDSISFHNGMLQITNGMRFMRIQPWPPVAWCKASVDSCWSRCRCSVSLDELESESRKTIWSHAPNRSESEAVGMPLLPFATDRANASMRFLELIPLDVRNVVRRFGARKFAILKFLSDAGRAGVQLAESGNLALVFMLANPSRILGRFLTSDEVRFLLRRRRRELVEFMGFPPVAVNVLKKVVPSQLTISQCLKLRTLLWSCRTDKTIAKTLFHLPKVNRAVIRIVSSPNLLGLVEPEFVRTIASETENESIVDMLICVTKLLAWPGVQRHNLPRFSSKAHLKGFVEELEPEAWVARQMAAAEYGRRIPPPPLPGVSGPDFWVEPLASLEAIIAEGKAQNLCLKQATHVAEVAAGEVYLYSVRTKAGDRATLLIEKTIEGWQVGTVAASCNQTSGYSVLHACQQWLDDCQNREAIPF